MTEEATLSTVIPISDIPVNHILKLEDITPKDLEKLKGEFVTFEPQRLLNRGGLFATQDWIDPIKMRNSLDGLPALEEEPPQVWLSLGSKGNVELTVDDGTHRIGLTALRRGEIPAQIKGVWKGEHRWGFNIITQQLKRALEGYNPGFHS